jgi:3-hydroxyisobutyrate dehydrogenase-like beta-hydroxyacid dehydrogenase
VVLSVLPPQAALPVAEQVAASGFAGTYVDANPLSPATLESVRAVVEGAGATLVDGGIVGPPPRDGHPTHLYLAGDHDRVAAVAALLPGPRLMPVVVGARVGQASAAKQAYALVAKGRMVLATMAADLADAHGVGDVLAAEHDRADASLLAELPELRQGLARVGWRWAPEFDELAASLTAAGVDPAAVAGLADRLRSLAR